MDWRAYEVHGARRDAGFYLTALQYGHFLWQQGRAARAMLCLDRAMGADLTGAEPEVAAWPMPYAAMAWILAYTPEDVFTGNPRVHFQHYADRMNEPRRAQRQARAWACWALTRRIRPELPGDPKHVVVEPDEAAIAAALDATGLPDETALWQSVARACRERHAP